MKIYTVKRGGTDDSRSYHCFEIIVYKESNSTAGKPKEYKKYITFETVKIRTK